MKLSKMFGLLALAALALMAFASTASATTLETNSVKQTGVVELTGSLTTGTSALLKDTSGVFANTCKTSHVNGKDSTSQTGTAVSGPISTLTFSGCTHETVNVDAPGTLSVEWIKGTTNGTVFSSGAKVTTPVTIFGSVVSATCTTEKTHLGTLTGAATGGTAELDINAVINCGSVLPSAKWEGTYVLTVPGSPGTKHAIGVVE